MWRIGVGYCKLSLFTRFCYDFFLDMIIPYCLFPKIFPKDVNKPYDKRRVFDFDCCPYVEFWGSCMLEMCDVRDVGCSGCGMFGM